MSDTPTPPAPGADDAPASRPGPRSEADILADPRLHEFVAAYHPLFYDLFLNSYARLIVELRSYGPRYDEQMAHLLHQYEEPAWEHLWQIQHKKLFDLECRWRARQVVVPGARLTADFEDWHDDMAACRVLPAITPAEVALYDAFLATLEQADPDDLENMGWTEYWAQRRDGNATEREEADLTLPEWSEFYDQHQGTSLLRLLPDLRGDQEERYVDAWRADFWARHEREEANQPPPEPADQRPHLPTHGAEFDALAGDLLRRYEPADLLRYHQAKRYLNENDPDGRFSDLDTALEQLRDAGPVSIPVEAHANWRQAIIRAAYHHRIRQIRQVLPRVYDDYCQREQLGIAHATCRPSWDKNPNPHRHFDLVAPHVRTGRVLLGEPDDLEF